MSKCSDKVDSQRHTFWKFYRRRSKQSCGSKKSLW